MKNKIYKLIEIKKIIVEDNNGDKFILVKNAQNNSCIKENNLNNEDIKNIIKSVSVNDFSIEKNAKYIFRPTFQNSQLYIKIGIYEKMVICMELHKDIYSGKTETPTKQQLYRNNINNSLTFKPNIFNGFKTFDLELVENIISYIASKVHNLTAVNLSQYLWFIDALSFQQRGVSITGLVYEKKQKNLFIIEKKHIEISLLNNKYFINDKSFNLISKENYDLTKLKPDEIGIINSVINILKNKETAEILSILYKEESWENTEENNEISFEYMLDKRI